MPKPLAIRATYGDLKLIKTRGVLQIVLEAPVEDHAAVMEVMGGFPQPGEAKWFAIAPINVEVPGKADRTCEPDTASSRTAPSRTKRSFRDLPASQQAGIRCEEAAFSMFLQEVRPDDWRESDSDPAGCVRLICCVGSRADLDTNHRARVIWNQLDSGYEAWRIVERA